MLHSLEQRYVKLRDEHGKVKQQRDDLLGKEAALGDRLAEEQRISREVRHLASSRAHTPSPRAPPRRAKTLNARRLALPPRPFFKPRGHAPLHSFSLLARVHVAFCVCCTQARTSAAALEAAALDQRRYLQRTQAELTAAREVRAVQSCCSCSFFLS
jgi:hypothetical protein